MPSHPPRQVSSRSAICKRRSTPRRGRPSRDGSTPGVQAELVELLLLRGHVLGCIADYERAEARAEQLTHDRPTDGVAFLARARARATFHRFTDALGDLDDALRLGADAADVDAERAAIFQAIGRYDEAFTILRNAVERRADFASLAALASLCADRGDVATAEQLLRRES